VNDSARTRRCFEEARLNSRFAQRIGTNQA
jgi:hypothetical protein